MIGFWGVGAFENEHAMAWLDDMLEADGLDDIPFALTAVIEHGAAAEESGDTEEGALPLTDGCCALAAAEVVAALAGRPAKNLPQDVQDFVKELDMSVAADVVNLALEAVDTVTRADGLRTHWKSEGAMFEWLEAVEDLEKRLKAALKTRKSS